MVKEKNTQKVSSFCLDFRPQQSQSHVTVLPYAELGGWLQSCSGMIFQCQMSRAPLEAKRTHLKLTGVVLGGGANARRTAVDKEESYGSP